MADRPQTPHPDNPDTPIGSALLLLDRQGAVTGWNSAAVTAIGYDADELHGLAFDRLFTTGAPLANIAAVLRIADRNGRFSGRGWFTRKNGGRVEALLTIEAIYGKKETVAGFAATLGDRAAQRQSEAAIADSEQQLRMLLQGVVDFAIYLLDPRGYISNLNVGGERIKGYTAKEIIGQHFSRFYTETERAAGEPQRGLAIAARDGRYEREGWRVRKDGTQFWASVVIDRILDPAGQVAGFAKVTRDLTEQKRAGEALEQTRAALAQAQKMEAVGQLTGGVAHDFNNLLTVITNALDLLGGPVRDDPQKQRIIDSAQRAVDRGARLTQQLLAFSRRQPLRPEIHSINGLVEGFEAVLRRACPEPVEINVVLSPLPLAANVDAPQFEAALLNLVVNARDAMPGGGKLRIATGKKTVGAAEAKRMSGIAPGDFVTVAVTDTGEGMSRDVLPRVFEPFFTTKEIGKGSGLGLSQVHGFVTQSGGHVAIDSKSGAGTTVTLYLPAVSQAAAGLRRGQSDAEGAAGRILVVEDDPEVLDVAVEMLRGLGYEVLTAPDGPSALAVLRRDAEIDVLFTDIVMPRGMNGVELAREARRLRPKVRVLLASGYPASVLAADHGAGDDGEFAFLGKPYRRAELADKLRALQDS
jgi:PAS domain S-box-containing protein